MRSRESGFEGGGSSGAERVEIVVQPSAAEIDQLRK